MKRFILFTVAALLSALFSVGIGLGEENKKIPDLAKPAVASAKMFDANNLAMWVLNNGNFATNPETGQSGLFYPKGQTSKTLIYTSGLIIGAYLDDSLHTMVNSYMSDAAPGAVAANGEPYGRDDPAFRVYKINVGDTPAANPDYAEWPSEQGAPVNPDGTPKILGDQMLWCCYTDAYPELHTVSLTAPLKAEVHFSVWGWRLVQNIIFLKWEIYNRNNKPWRNTLVGIFCDPDLGDANDDAIGSDTTLQVVYCYNGDAIDTYGYGEFPPAIGYVFLQPPSVTLPGSLTPSPVQTFSPMIIKSSPGDWGDISLQSPFTAMQAYNRMQALSEDGDEMIDPVANQRAYWAYTGDPLTGEGWIDVIHKDRRMMLSAGPFDLQPGEKQELVMAIVVGQGEDYLSSIPQAKKTAGTAQVFYHNNFTFSRLQKPQLTGSCIEERMLLSWSDISVDYEEQANASSYTQAYQFEGYVLLQSEYGYSN